MRKNNFGALPLIMAALAMGGGVDLGELGYLGPVPSGKPNEPPKPFVPTDFDRERIRLAEEKRNRKAERKAANIRKARKSFDTTE